MQEMRRGNRPEPCKENLKMDKPVISTNLKMGAGGTILDELGRVVCTMNLKKTGLSVAEAYAYAQIFITSVKYFDGIMSEDEQ